MSNFKNDWVCYTSRRALNLASTEVGGDGTERKFYDALNGQISISTSFTSYSPDAIAVGSGSTQRNGRAVTCYAIEVSGWFMPSDTSQVVRVIVNNRPSGYIAAPNLTIGNNYDYALNVGEEKQTFLADDRIGFPATVNATGLTYPTIPYSRIFRCQLPMRWGGAAHITDNCPFVSFISDSAAVTHPTFDGVVRFWFKDK